LFYQGYKGTTLISGYSKQTVKNNFLDEACNFIEVHCKGNVKYNSSSGEMEVGLGNKSYDCLVVGAGKIDSEKSIRGSTIAQWFGDEITLHHYSFFKQAFNRMSIEGARAFGTTNPDTPNHWLYTDYIKPYFDGDKNIKEIMEYWHFTLEDNANLDPQYVKNISRAYKGAFYQRNIGGLWVVADGLVYDTFNEAKHSLPHEEVVKMIHEGTFAEFFFGIDWGWTHPSGVTLWGVTRKGKYCLIDCLKKNHVQPSDIDTWLREKQTEYGKFFREGNGDNARPEHNQKLREKGWNIMERKPLVEDRTSLMRELINKDRISVSDRCQDYLNEMSCYRYPDSDMRIKLPQDKWYKPIQENNDVIDCAEYAVWNYEDRFGTRFRQYYL
jgi:PBSX family phage terminase large subunit